MKPIENIVLVLLLVVLAFFLWILNLIANPADKANKAQADKNAALELLCTQNNGVPEWWEGQFVCIQKKADK